MVIVGVRPRRCSILSLLLPITSLGLLRILLVLALVNESPQFCSLGQSVLGPTITRWLVGATVTASAIAAAAAATSPPAFQGRNAAVQVDDLDESCHYASSHCGAKDSNESRCSFKQVKLCSGLQGAFSDKILGKWIEWLVRVFILKMYLLLFHKYKFR